MAAQPITIQLAWLTGPGWAQGPAGWGVATALQSSGLGPQHRGLPRTPGCVTSQCSRSPSLSQSSLQGSKETRSAGLRRETSRAPAQESVPPASMQPSSPACCMPCSRPHQGSTCASTGPPLPGSLRGRGGGQRGGARSCQRPPGPVGTRGGMFPYLCPARSARAAQHTQAWLSAKPRPGGGCWEHRQRETPHLRAHQASVSFCVQTGAREGPACAGLAYSTNPATWRTHLQCPPSTGSSSSLPSLSPDPGTLSVRSQAGWA